VCGDQPKNTQLRFTNMKWSW